MVTQLLPRNDGTIRLNISKADVRRERFTSPSLKNEATTDNEAQQKMVENTHNCFENQGRIASLILYFQISKRIG